MQATTSQQRSLERFFPGASEMAQRMREFDWSTTDLGPPAEWPDDLRTAVSICLTSRFPIVLWWGPNLTLLYNDAYIPMLGPGKHPQSLGEPGSECWSDIWETVGPMLEGVMRSGQATWSEELQLFLNRHLAREEDYFTFSYSPILTGDAAKVGGIFCAVTETTDYVISRRRLATLRELGHRTAKIQSAEAVCARAGEVLTENAYDVPFAAFYLIDAAMNQGRLVASVRLGNSERFPSLVHLDAAAPSAWPIREVWEGRRPQDLPLPQAWSDLSGGAWPEPAAHALVLPIVAPGVEALGGVLIAGVSPRRVLDVAYRDFFHSIATQVGAALAEAHAYETERQRAEALAALDRAKTAFFSNVSHEFRTPLTLMLGPLEEALRDASAANMPAWRERLELMRRNGLRLQKLVNTLLDFSRIEAGRIEANFEETDLASFTAQLASMFASAVKRAGIRLVVDCPPTTQMAYVDRDMWEKIVLNLLSNAFKFTLEGEIGVALRQTANAFELVVRDTGVGIPAEEMPQLFDRFHRVRHARARTHEGTGIGLAFVQELVGLHAGTVEAASEVGRGTRFTVRIPQGKTHLPADRINVAPTLTSTALGGAPFVEEALRWLPDSGKSAPSSPWLVDATTTAMTAPVRTVACAGAHIIVADDNADMRDYLRGLLGQYWSVETVADGRAALRLAQEGQPELIVSDVMMPGLDGFELLRALRSEERTQGVPVILLSARAGEEAAVEALAAGADAYLVKPFSARELVAYVAGHLQLHRLRREADAALRASEEKFASAFGQSPLALTITSLADGRLVEVNDCFVQLCGYSREQALGRTIDELQLWVEPERRAQGLSRLRAGERISNAEVRYRTRSGEERVGMIGSTVIHIDGRPHVLSSIADITERKRAEEGMRDAREQLAAANEALKDADRRKDEFLAMLGHELRNPLAAVRNAVATASLDAAHQTHALEIARRQTDQLGRLIDDLLDVTRITQGRISLHKERVHLAEVLERAIDSTRPLIESRRVRLTVSMPPTPIAMDADPARLEQVFVNLLSNAAKYTDPGGTITVTAYISSGTVTVRIRDSGIGIASEMLSRIWDLFTQGARALDRSQGGLGIGLTVARRVIELHGGRIEAHSDGPGKGSEFVVTLQALEDTVETALPAPASRQAEQRSARVLLVEDNPDAADSLTMLLELLGHCVRAVHDGLAALEAARANPPEVMLVDIGLPGIDGYEVARRVRRDPALRHIVLVALTGYGRDEDKQQAMAAGFDYHLAKPVNPDALSGLVARLGNESSKKPSTVH